MLRTLLILLMVIGVGLPVVGGTLASWSDSETMEDNYIETGSLDLLVAKCGDNWTNPGSFSDDGPWGTGLSNCFDIPKLETGDVYSSYLLLWNAGTTDGRAYLHIKNVAGSPSLAGSTGIKIYYGSGGNNGDTDLPEVARGTIAGLDSQEIELGVLPKETTRKLKLELEATAASAGDSLSFDISFELIELLPAGQRIAWADTEFSPNSLQMAAEPGGLTAFWSGSQATSQYGKSEIVGWFRETASSSNWFTDIALTGNDDQDYKTLAGILKSAGAGEMVKQFRAQYMATRLNIMASPPRLQRGTVHNITTIKGAEDYFGYANAPLGKIIITIENSARGDISSPSSKAKLEMMKKVCDDLNNCRL